MWEASAAGHPGRQAERRVAQSRGAAASLGTRCRRVLGRRFFGKDGDAGNTDAAGGRRNLEMVSVSSLKGLNLRSWWAKKKMTQSEPICFVTFFGQRWNTEGQR